MTQPAATPRVAPSKRVATQGACRHYAPCGNKCVLDATVPHELHCCRDSSCYCHSKERYEDRE